MAKTQSDVARREAKVTPLKDPVERTDGALQAALDLQADLERETRARQRLEAELEQERAKVSRLETELAYATKAAEALQANASLRQDRRSRKRGSFGRRR